MRHSHILATAVAVTLGFASMAQAQPHHERRAPAFHGPGAHPGGHAHGPHHAGPPHGVRPHPGGPRYAKPSHAHPHPGYRPPAPPPNLSYGLPPHRWAPGHRVPMEYRGPRYHVNDWRRHGLYAPPHGHHWVRYGADYLLVAVATGVIANLVINHY